MLFPSNIQRKNPLTEPISVEQIHLLSILCAGDSEDSHSQVDADTRCDQLDMCDYGTVVNWFVTDCSSALAVLVFLS